MAGDHHHCGIDALGGHEIEHLLAVFARHLDVAEHYIVVLLVYHFLSLDAVFGGVDLVSFVSQNLLQRIPDRPFVVYYKYFHISGKYRNFSLYLCQPTSGLKDRHSKEKVLVV